jgi:hypothetical protein
MPSSVGCPAGTHWDEGCCCCVDDGLSESFQTLYRLASQVSYAAIRGVFSASREERAAKMKSSISILKSALKKLTDDRPSKY